MGFPSGSVVKESVCQGAGDTGLILGLEKNPGGGNGITPSCLPGKSSRESGTKLHGVTNSQIRLSDWAYVRLTELLDFHLFSPLPQVTMFVPQENMTFMQTLLNLNTSINPVNLYKPS